MSSGIRPLESGERFLESGIWPLESGISPLESGLRPPASPTPPDDNDSPLPSAISHLSSCLAGPDGWWLAPEGAAVHDGEKAAVIADVHLGYEWARGAGGDQVPAHSLAETLAKLERLLARVRVGRLIVAGDLVESAAPCARRCDTT